MGLPYLDCCDCGVALSVLQAQTLLLECCDCSSHFYDLPVSWEKSGSMILSGLTARKGEVEYWAELDITNSFSM